MSLGYYNLWRQLFRNLGMKITTIVWVDSKNNSWLFGYHSPIKQTIHSGGKHDQVCRRILTPAHGPLGSLCFNLSCHCWRLRDRHLWFPDSKTMLFITRNYRVDMGIFFVHKSSKFYIAFRSGSRIFFRRGCTRLLLCLTTNKPHSFFCAEYQLY